MVRKVNSVVNHSRFRKILMRSIAFGFVATAVSLGALGQATTENIPPNQVKTITVEPGIQLEFKDWGGTGRPVVLLAGLGGSLHAYDDFAPRLTTKYHVYGISRRGYGASTAPLPTSENYDSNRLGDDVLAVMTEEKIIRPVLIGHSFAGAELSSIASRFPGRVAGLVYLDAANRYAYSPEHRGDFRIDSLELRRAIDAALDAISKDETLEAFHRIQELLPQYATDIVAQEKIWETIPEISRAEHDQRLKGRQTPEGQIEKAALDGEHRYTDLKCPILAIFALPHDHGLPPGPKRDEVDAWEMQQFGPLADDFEKGEPTARVVRIAHAKHAVFVSHPTEVLQEIDSFVASLPPPSL